MLSCCLVAQNGSQTASLQPRSQRPAAQTHHQLSKTRPTESFLGWAGLGAGGGAVKETPALLDSASSSTRRTRLPQPSACHLQGQTCHPGVWLQGCPGRSPPPRPRQQGPSWVRSGGGRALSCVQTPPGPALNSLSSRPCLPEGERGLWLLCKYAFQRPLLSHPASSPNPHYELAGLSEGPSGS